MRRPIPYFEPNITARDIAAVTTALKSGRLSNGPQARALELQLTRLSGHTTAVAVSSGTASLHLALVALGVSEGDEVIVPAYVCSSLAHAVRYTGATPVVVDVREEDGNIAPEAVKNSMSPRTRAIIVPHMFGRLADIASVKKYSGGVPIVEDHAMSLGVGKASRDLLGDIAVYSFYTTKMVSGGEGGAVATSRPDLAGALADLREYDKKVDSTIRYNYKLNELAAALIVSQLKRLRSFVRIRKQIGARYHRALALLPVALPPAARDHVHCRFVIRTAHAAELRTFLASRGIQSGHGVVGGLHRMMGTTGGFPVTDQWLNEGVALPLYPGLSASDQAYIIAQIKEFYGNKS